MKAIVKLQALARGRAARKAKDTAKDLNDGNTLLNQGPVKPACGKVILEPLGLPRSELEAAATAMQAHPLGRSTRKEVQATGSGSLNAKPVEVSDREKEAAAIRIQALQRGRQVRKEMARQTKPGKRGCADASSGIVPSTSLERLLDGDANSGYAREE